MNPGTAFERSTIRFWTVDDVPDDIVHRSFDDATVAWANNTIRWAPCRGWLVASDYIDSRRDEVVTCIICLAAVVDVIPR